MKAFLVVTLFALPLLSRAETLTLPAGETVQQSESKNHLQPKYYINVGFASSRSALKNSARTMKSTSPDDGSGSGGGEKSSFPNLNYVSAATITSFNRNQHLLIAGTQSLDTPDARTIETPSGAKFQLPGQVLAARYAHTFAENWKADVGALYMDTFKLLDPSAGLTYLHFNEGGAMSRTGLSLTAPVTEKSKNDKLITKATLRQSLLWLRDRWSFSGSFSHSRPFQQKGATVEGPQSASAAPNGSRSGGFSSGNHLEEIDIVLSQKETSRTTSGFGLAFLASKHLRLAASMGAAYLETAKRRSIWTTTVKPVAVTFTQNNWEASSDFTLNSDLSKYHSPSLPKNWNVGVRIAYSFGERPNPITL